MMASQICIRIYLPVGLAALLILLSHISQCTGEVVAQPIVPVYKGRESVNITLRTGCLHAHNMLRRKHGVKPLKWDYQLAKKAQQWAIHMANEGRISHSPYSKLQKNGKCVGENVACRSSTLKDTIYPPEFLIYDWYDGVEKFDFNNPESGANSKSYHFTQLVWKGSRKLGCGEALGINGKTYATYLVCQYFPAGNAWTQFGRNVKPLRSGEKAVTCATEVCTQGCINVSSSCLKYTKTARFKTAMCNNDFMRSLCCFSCQN